jgi:hypothetical protein
MTLSEKKNRGEWSELYALVHILAEGKIRSGVTTDEKELLDFQVVSVSRKIDRLNHVFQIAGYNVEVLDTSSQNVINVVPRSELLEQSELLLSKIKTKEGPSFAIPEAKSIMTTLGIDKVSGNGEKTDLTIKTYDPRIKQETEQGFSIKSFMGSKPTLLNASGATNIEYTITGNLSQTETKELNKLGPADIVASLYEVGHQLIPTNIDKRFAENLKMIDSDMDSLLAHVVLSYFQGKGRSMKDILKNLVDSNPINYSPTNSEIRYTHKIKDLLEAVALGMRPSIPWAGNADAKGGHIIITSKGEVLCRHALDKETLRNYLFENLVMDRPSRKKFNYGTITDNKLLLNFQIRFK